MKTRQSGYGQIPDPLHVPVAQVLPAQQGSSEPPQATQLALKLPPDVWQTRSEPVQLLPLQHACPVPPQATQV